jgi:hypothetical protein
VTLEAVTSVNVPDVTPCSLVELYQTSEIQVASFPDTMVILKQTVTLPAVLDFLSLSNSIGLSHHIQRYIIG